MANNEDWVDLPVEKKEQDDWADVPLEADHFAEGQAALEHFGNAASQGYLPQLQAKLEPITDRVFNAWTGQDVEPAPMSQLTENGPEYVAARDRNISRIKKESDDHPYTSIAGTVGGSIASAIPMGAALGKIPLLGKLSQMSAPAGAGLAARTAALAGRTAGAAETAYIQGALANPGDKEGEVDVAQMPERGKNAAMAATIAAPLHLAGEGVSSVGKYISDRLKNKANTLAFRALGPFKRQVNQNRDEIQDIGREALDSGVVRWMPGSAKTLEERAGEAAGATGKELGSLTDKLIELEKQSSSSGMSRKQMADNLRKQLLVENPQGIPGIDKRNQVFENMISEFEQDPGIRKIATQQNLPYEEAEKIASQMGYQPKPMSFGDLRQAKMNVQGTKGQDGLINWNRLKNADIPVDEQFHRALAGELRAGEEAGADAIEKAHFGESSNQLKTLKDKFGNLSKAEQIAGNKADAQRANQILGLKDAIYGGAGATTGALIGSQLDERGSHENAKLGAEIGGSIGALGSKAARDYGPQLSAKMADLMSKVSGQISPVVEKILLRNPTLIPQFVENFERQKK